MSGLKPDVGLDLIFLSRIYYVLNFIEVYHSNCMFACMSHYFLRATDYIIMKLKDLFSIGLVIKTHG